MQAVTLKDVSADGPKQRIVVRLPRIWESKGLRDGVIYELAFIAVDHEGNMMEGNVPSAHMHKFTDLLKEGAVYAMQNYMVKPARKSYRAVDNRYRITITQYTRVDPVHPGPANIPLIPYKLQPLSILEDRYASKNIVLSDVAGILIELTCIICPTGEGDPRRNIKIQDMDENQFNITLWGHEAENFDEDAVRHDYFTSFVRHGRGVSPRHRL